MALAQYCRLPKYLEFFQRKVEEGDTVILDNGAYEETPVLSSELSRWAKEVKPTVVILPDVPHDMMATIYSSMRYLDRYGVPKEAMMVLHAKPGDAASFIAMYNNCPTKWVGFSRLTTRYSAEAGSPNQRADFARVLKAAKLWRGDINHHALGMQNGNLRELVDLNSQDFTSCDSSAPIWRGLHGFGLGCISQGEKWPDYSYDPQATEFAATGLQVAEQNLTLVLDSCNAPLSTGTEA